MLLSCGFAEVLFFLLGIVFNLPLPLVAIQLLWLNLVTDGLQDISLSLKKTASQDHLPFFEYYFVVSFICIIFVE